MVEKGQWTVLLYLVAKRLPGLRLSPPEVKVERDRRPRWLGNYSHYKTNAETLPVACLSEMQYGRALDRLLCDIVFADPALVPVYILKTDVSDGFYRIGVFPEDAPKLVLIFPSGANEEPMVAIPLMLPMGWKNSPPLFCTATETVAGFADEYLSSHHLSIPHKLDNRAEVVAPQPAAPLAKKTCSIDSRTVPAAYQCETLGVFGCVCGQLPGNGAGATAPPPPRPPHALSRVRQGVPAPLQAGRQTAQGSPLAKEAGFRGLFMLQFPDPTLVDC